jgi:hypothetical protein
MYPTDPTGELTRQRIADLHAQGDRQRLARSVHGHPASRAPTLRQAAAAVLVVAVLIAAVVIQVTDRFV